MSPAEGSLLQSLTQDGRVELWALPPASIAIRTRDDHGREIATTIVSVEGFELRRGESFAVSPDLDAVTMVFDTTDGKRIAWHRRVAGGPVATLDVKNPRSATSAVPWRTRRLVALAGGPNTMPCIWDTETGATCDLVGHVGDVRSIRWNHQGTRVATGGMDRTVRIFASDGTPLDVERHHNDAIWSVRFSHDGRMLASASQDGTIRLGACPRRCGLTLDATLLGHGDWVGAVEFSNDDRWIVSAGADRTMRMVNRRASLNGDIVVRDNASGRIDVARHANRVAATNTGGVPREWDVTRGVQLLAEIPQPVERYGSSADIAISPDGERVLVLEAAKQSLCTPRDGGFAELWQGSLVIANGGFAEDGEAIGIVRAAAPPYFELRRLPEGTLLSPPYPKFVSTALQSTPDGRRFAIECGKEGAHVVSLVDAATGALIQSFPLGTGTGWTTGALADGRQVLVAFEADHDPEPIRAITVRDARDGSLIKRVEGLPAHGFALALTPDGQRLLSAGRDRVLHVWDTATWDQVVALPGPGSYIWAMRLSGDGETLAMACGDRTYRVWRAPKER
ncbi:MAG: WD40 repeat domain-containing protein [Phycisphaerales bacterium]